MQGSESKILYFSRYIVICRKGFSDFVHNKQCCSSLTHLENENRVEFSRFCHLHGSVTWICLYLNWLLAVMRVMHETGDSYSIWSTWLCYWLDQFITPALNTWILSKFSILHWICPLFILLILVGVEIPLCIVVTLYHRML